MNNKNDFFLSTIAEFDAVCFGSIPKRPADYISDSGSMYWYDMYGVYRLSDHWGFVASCYWRLKNKTSGTAAGYCAWTKFKSYTTENLAAARVTEKTDAEKRADLWLSKMTKKELALIEKCEEHSKVRKVYLPTALIAIYKCISDIPGKALEGSTVIYSECTYSDFPKAYKYSPEGTVCTFIFKKGRPVLVDAQRTCTHKHISWIFSDSAKAAIIDSRNR